MSFEFSLAHLTVLHLSPAEMIRVAAKTGYQCVSLRLEPVVNEPIVDLMHNKENLRETLACLKNENIGVHDIELVRLTPDSEPQDFTPMLETGAQLGARAVMVQILDADKDRAIDQFGRFCDLADSFGLTAELEFVPWIEVANLGDAVDIIAAVNRPNAGLLIDTLHFFRSDSSLDQLGTLPQDWFHFVQLCDAKDPAPETEEEVISVARTDRFPPGQGDLDLKSLVELIPKVPYSLEIPNHKLMKQLGEEEYCRQTRQAAENFLNNCRI